ncbi:MAG: S8 family serine peptidase [Pirellulales bacterium]|nr:S8 family serine peptidase [Pirellulales bacterium]
MNWKVWRNTLSCARCARGAKWLSFAFIVVFGILTATCEVAFSQAPAEDLQLASASLYLQNPLPSPQAGAFAGTYNLNTIMGANRFYNAGFTGTQAVMANIEAGYIWNGHETLAHVTNIPTSGATGEVDRHATWVGMVMGGRPGGATPGNYQQGLAPDAQLASGAIATSWPSGNASYPRYTTAFYLNYYGLSTFGPYRAAFISGVPTNTGLRPADVVNSSWVAGNSPNELAGNDNLSGTLDALINQNPRTLFTVAAGNTTPSGTGPNRVPAPASAYNNLTVAALAVNGGAFDLPSYFTNGGPNNYYDPVNGTVNNVRQVVDIAAPGEHFSSAYYGGLSGGNGPSVYGPASGPLGGPNYYSRDINGTSFAAPTVAGGAALLYDAAYSVLPAITDASDSRVMKAVLQNSADKTTGWNNGQTPNPNGFGGVLTTRGVDDRVGAGRMDLDRAFDQLLAGTTDLPGLSQGAMGTVAPIGWDFGQVGQGIVNDYRFPAPLAAGSLFTATLTWFRDRLPSGTTSFSEASFDNLDLELWNTIAGTPQYLISASNSLYNNTEHFQFAIPTTGEYLLRVRWVGELFDLVGDANLEQYGLAWSASVVPEPNTLLLLLSLAISAALAHPRAR